MIQNIKDTTTLHNGVKMPWLGLGVWKVPDDEVPAVIKAAVEIGYRSIDTASAYHNEVGVGQGIADSGVARENLFVTTKVGNKDQGYESTLAAFDSSMEKLGLDYLDLYLIHWPGGVPERIKDTWRAIEKLYKEGRVRAIGVCNFKTHHLDSLIEEAEIIPMVNQVEFHPLLTQKPLLQYCKEKNIQLEAYSPLMQGQLDHPSLLKLAEKYSKTPAQIVLRWDLQNGVVTIPKSVRPERMAENAAIFDFQLSEEDMQLIDGMNKDQRFTADPDTYVF